MKIRFAFMALFFSLISTDFALAAPESIHRWVETENHSDGSRTLLVIDEDPTLRNDPTVISQKVLFKKRFTQDQTDEFEAAKAHYRSEPLSRETLRLPRSGDPLWIAEKDEWTPDDETSYSQWIAKQDTHFLEGTNLYADCADVGLAFRWVYARDHHLPIANTLAGSGKLFGNFTGSDRWDELPTDDDWRKDERFKAALRELFDQTYTVTIAGDQYPIAITLDNIHPGTMYMINRGYNGHTQTIHTIDIHSGMTSFWGDEPAGPNVFHSGLTFERPGGWGFGNWRHVRRTVKDGKEKWALISGKDMPGYSREQYDVTSDFGQWVYAKLGIYEGSARFLAYTNTFIGMIDYRRSVTGDGAYYCSPAAPCQGQTYDDYSTPSRDARLKQTRDDLLKLFESIPVDSNVVNALKELDDCGEVAFASGVTCRDALFKDGVVESWSSDPNRSYYERWGYPVAVTPTDQLRIFAGHFLAVMQDRDERVYWASDYCSENHCKPGMPIPTGLSTKEIDERLPIAYAELMRLNSDSSVTNETRDLIRTYYQDEVSDAASKVCKNSEQCVLDDIIWADGAASRISDWTSYIGDSTNQRWGLPK